MSKIQEALRQLRDRGHEETRDDKRGHAARDNNEKSFPVKRSTSPKADAESSGENASFHPLADHAPVPRFDTAVDLGTLREAGLLPPADSSERLLNQFRRAKRPLVSGAFELGIPIGDNSNIIMIASALPGAGKTFCALNLAMCIARERDFDAVLVDADVLKPNITKTLGLHERVGLIDYLSNPEIDIEDIVVSTDLFGIHVIPAGRLDPESSELLASKRMADLVSSLSNSYKKSVVVFDMPPLLVTNEAQALAEHAGQIVFVIESAKSSQDSVLRALGTLNRDKPINVIVNKSNKASGAGFSGEDYGYYPYQRWSDSDAPNG